MNKSSKTSIWQFSVAKAKLGGLFRRARAGKPQYVTSSKKNSVGVIAAERFQELTASHPRTGLAEFFRNSPLVDYGIESKREFDRGRDIEL